MAIRSRPGKSKSLFYLTVAGGLSLVTSLVWALDRSLVYILLGAALFFLFLFFWNQPKPISSRQPPPRQDRQPNRHPSEKDLIASLRKAFESRATMPSNPAGKRSFAVIVAMAVFGGFFFLIVLLSLVFSGSPEYFEADVYFEQAENWRRIGEYDSADRYYLVALDLNPEHPAALAGYGNSLLARNRYDTALQTLDAALAIDPTNEAAAYGKALVYHYKKQYDRSIKSLMPLLEINPAHFDGLLLYGDNYYVRNRYDSAIYWYEKGYAAGQRTTLLCHVMAYIYDAQGKTDLAVQYYTEALSMDSTVVDIYVRLSELFPGPDGDQYRTKVQELRAEGY